MPLWDIQCGTPYPTLYNLTTTCYPTLYHQSNLTSTSQIQDYLKGGQQVFDQKCHELAEHFFPNAPPHKLEELAQLLQDACDDFDPDEPDEEEDEDEEDEDEDEAETKP